LVTEFDPDGRAFPRQGSGTAHVERGFATVGTDTRRLSFNFTDSDGRPMERLNDFANTTGPRARGFTGSAFWDFPSPLQGSVQFSASIDLLALNQGGSDTFSAATLDVFGLFVVPRGLTTTIPGGLTIIPEPSSLLLFASGLVSLVWLRKRMR
jgi:hypothetical protein